MEFLPQLQAIGESTRLTIMKILQSGPRPAGEIARHFAISRTAVSQHLAVLRQADLVIQEKRATQRIYRINRSTLGGLIDHLQSMQGGGAVSKPIGEILPRAAESEAAPVPASQSTRASGPISRSPADSGPEPTPEHSKAMTSSPALDDAVNQRQPAGSQAGPASSVAGMGQLGRHAEVNAEISVRAEPDALFECLTNEQLMGRWFASSVVCEPRESGRLRLSDGDTVTVTGRFLTVEAGRHLTFTWGGVEGLVDGESQVDIWLRTTATGTQVVLRHSRLPERLLATYQNVWNHAVLPNLREMAEGRVPLSPCIGSTVAQ